MQQEREKSLKSARTIETILGATIGLLAGAALMGSIAIGAYEPSTAATLGLAATIAWATICNQAKGMLRGRVLRTDFASILYIALAMTSPGRIPLLAGILAGLSIWLLIVRYVVLHPAVSLREGDRLYQFRYPLARFLPLFFLAPEPLTGIFEPIATLHFTPVAVGLPIWRISVFDPQSLHEYLSTRVGSLSSGDPDWDATVTRHRLSLRVLGLLEALSKLERENLDWVALAAAARLALFAYPESAKRTLIDALMTFRPYRRRIILDSFDLLPARI
jgi:hypothetical protein